MGTKWDLVNQIAAGDVDSDDVVVNAIISGLAELTFKLNAEVHQLKKKVKDLESKTEVVRYEKRFMATEERRVIFHRL